MPPRLQEERARQVLAKIDQILAWQREFDNERDTRFVELGRYLSIPHRRSSGTLTRLPGSSKGHCTDET